MNTQRIRILAVVVATLAWLGCGDDAADVRDEAQDLMQESEA